MRYEIRNPVKGTVLTHILTE